MTEPYYQGDHVTLYHGDCLDVLAELPDASVDSVVTDPPYGLEFMGKDWDRFSGAVSDRDFKGSQFQQWCELWAAECLRLLKPGGHLVSFGGSRTWHRLAAAIEDAGFEIRDSIAWLYGSGFPKSLDVSKAIDKAAGAERDIVGAGPFAARRPRADHASQGLTYADDAYVRPAGHEITAPATDAAKQWRGWGTALKPAFEPIVVARKPLSGTVSANVMAHGTGALNIDACRVAHDEPPGKPQQGMASRRGGQLGGGGTSSYRERETDAASPAGRWPPNVAIDEHTAAGIDEQSGDVKGKRTYKKLSEFRFQPGEGWEGRQKFESQAGLGDSGGASRFFPTFRYEPKAPTTERPAANGIAHPTVKPLDLMRWLVRLVTPPHGLVLEPFAGSGTTAEACIHEHMRCITIEREADYLPLIVARLSKPMAVGFDFEVPA